MLAGLTTAARMTFQSTPPRGGRREARDSAAPDSAVSIHAPARGATRRRFDRRDGDAGFNPRPRAGGDPVRASSTACSADVSIHAPARGATRPVRSAHVRPRVCFNPRPRAGGDRLRALASTRDDVSIHAPARGATRGRDIDAPTRSSFNPRPRVGGDLRLAQASSRSVFQSTPPRGGRPSTLDAAPRVSPFQSTPPRGGRQTRRDVASAPRGFNPRPRAGGDRASARYRRHCRGFNPRPRAGGDAGRSGRARRSRFQSTPPARGATVDLLNAFHRTANYAHSREPACGPEHAQASAGTVRCRSPCEALDELAGAILPDDRACACGSREPQNDERAVQVERRLGADMLDAAVPVGAEIVEAQAVACRDRSRPASRALSADPLRRVDLALEDRVLHPLAVVLAGLGDPTQAPPTGRRSSVLTS